MIRLLVPSRERPDNMARLLSAIAETSDTGAVHVVVGVDDNDPTLDDYARVLDASDVPTHLYVAPTPTCMARVLNESIVMETDCACARAEVLGFVGDDHLPRTSNWDGVITAALARLRVGIVYGNDLIQGAKLPTAVFLSAGIVRTIGYMAPPDQRHMYLDNWWRDLGRAAGCLEYLPAVVIEHLHPVGGTAPVDDGYRRVNAQAIYDADGAAYAAYKADGRFARDVDAVRALAVATPA